MSKAFGHFHSIWPITTGSLVRRITISFVKISQLICWRWTTCLSRQSCQRKHRCQAWRTSSKSSRERCRGRRVTPSIQPRWLFRMTWALATCLPSTTITKGCNHCLSLISKATIINHRPTATTNQRPLTSRRNPLTTTAISSSFWSHCLTYMIRKTINQYSNSFSRRTPSSRKAAIATQLSILSTLRTQTFWRSKARKSRIFLTSQSSSQSTILAIWRKVRPLVLLTGTSSWNLNISLKWASIILGPRSAEATNASSKTCTRTTATCQVARNRRCGVKTIESSRVASAWHPLTPTKRVTSTREHNNSTTPSSKNHKCSKRSRVTTSNSRGCRSS